MLWVQPNRIASERRNCPEMDYGFVGGYRWYDRPSGVQDDTRINTNGWI